MIDFSAKKTDLQGVTKKEVLPALPGAVTLPAGVKRATEG